MILHPGKCLLAAFGRQGHGDLSQAHPDRSERFEHSTLSLCPIERRVNQRDTKLPFADAAAFAVVNRHVPHYFVASNLCRLVGWVISQRGIPCRDRCVGYCAAAVVKALFDPLPPVVLRQIRVIRVRYNLLYLQRVDSAKVDFTRVTRVGVKRKKQIAVVVFAPVEILQCNLPQHAFVTFQEVFDDLICAFVRARDLHAAPENVLSRHVDAALNHRILDEVQPRDQHNLLDAPPGELRPRTVYLAPPFSVLQRQFHVSVSASRVDCFAQHLAAGSVHYRWHLPRRPRHRQRLPQFAIIFGLLPDTQRLKCLQLIKSPVQSANCLLLRCLALVASRCHAEQVRKWCSNRVRFEPCSRVQRHGFDFTVSLQFNDQRLSQSLFLFAAQIQEQAPASPRHQHHD